MSKQFEVAFAAYEKRRRKAANRAWIDGKPWYVRALVKGLFIGWIAGTVVVLCYVWLGIAKFWMGA